MGPLRWMTLLLGSLFLSSTAVAAPHQGNVWTNAGLNVTLSDRVRIGFNEELRLELSEAPVQELNSQLSLGFEATGWLALGAHYRLDLEGWDERLFFDHRFGIDGQVGGSAGPLALSVRQRVQPELSSSPDDPFRVVLRTRLRARAEVTAAVQPYVAVEPYLVASSQVWDRLRFDAGLTFPTLGLDVSYRLDEPLAQPGAPHRHIVTVGFTGSVDLRREPVDAYADGGSVAAPESDRSPPGSPTVSP